MALPESQALLHCPAQVVLYTVVMTLGKRIKAARERLNPKPTQGDVAAHFKITDKAVSAWERDMTIPEVEKLADLASLLKVPSNWLLKGRGAPPDPDSLESEMDDLSPGERAILAATLQAIRNQRKSA
jgi:transcriptional regulator with XRE-family HTH domain